MTMTEARGTDRWNTPERAALRETVRAFAAKEILPHVERWEDEGELPRDLHRAAARIGLLGLGTPESVGGEGELIDQLVVSEEAVLAGVPTGVLASLFTHGIALPALIADGREHLVRDYIVPRWRASSCAPSPSPNRTPDPTSRTCAPGPFVTVTSGCSTGPRPSSPPATAPTS